MKRTILAIFAHPDDETFSVGGTLDRYSKQGADVYLVTATKGERGMTGPYIVSSLSQLAKIREKELKIASKIIGIKSVVFLGFEDGKLDAVDKSIVKEKIKEQIRRLKPQVVITFEPEGITRHNDHIMISECTGVAVEETQKAYGLPLKFYWTVMDKNLLKKLSVKGVDGKPVEGKPDHEITTRIDIRDFLGTKIKALQAYKSQIKDVEGMIPHLLDGAQKEECFILRNSLVSSSKRESDLFDGL